MKNIKKIIVATSLFIGSLAFAQAPEKMSYQAVVRNTTNNLVTNQAVGMQISILQGSATGIAVYVETQTPTSNANGLVSLEIGSGAVVSGNMATINWANGPYFIKTETDPTGGSSYTITGTSQLLSTPYALYAKTSGSSTPGPAGPMGPAGVNGTNGTNGTNGMGVPTGGTTGQVLAKVDATNFNTQWVTPSGGGGSTILLRATSTTSQTFPFGGNAVVPDVATCFNNIITNVGSAYNTATGVFTAPTAGLYSISIQVVSTTNVLSLCPMIDVNNDFTTSGGFDNDYFGVYQSSGQFRTGTQNRGQLTTQVFLTAGQIFTLRFQNVSNAVALQNTTSGSTNLVITKM